MKKPHDRLARWTLTIGYASIAPPLLGALMTFGKERNEIFWAGSGFVISMLVLTAIMLDRVEKKKSKNETLAWVVGFLYFSMVSALSLIGFESNGFAWTLASTQIFGALLSLVGIIRSIRNKNGGLNQAVDTIRDRSAASDASL